MSTMTHPLGASHSSQNLRASSVYIPRRLPVSASSLSLQLPPSSSLHSLAHGSRARTSGTWTASSGGLGLLNNADEVEDRDVFVQEYNRLARKHGVRQLLKEDSDAHQRGSIARSREKRHWIPRFLRPNPNPNPQNASSSTLPPTIRHRRSVSEFAHIIHCRREAPRIIGIQDMVRLGGKSMLYLPQDYSPCTLILPTCIRATAQYLAQNVTTRGLFRVPGSSKITSALFDYYCYMDSGDASVAGTVRCATLPIHIQYSVHDVASTFKRLLSVLPGGILGSLVLLDAFIAIHSQLDGEPEYPRTKQTKVRARLIALAIGTVRSQYRRELICAVFGLLSLIGRASEVAPREDDNGRPLPTADLMGYHSLGIVFGPLLVGDSLDRYTMKVVTPSSGMLLFPLSPPKFRRDRRKSQQADTKASGPPTVDKILVANNITQMLIANWRDVVRQMRSLGTHYRKDSSLLDFPAKNDDLQDSEGLGERPEEIMDAVPGLRHASRPQEPSTGRQGAQTRKSTTLRKTASRKVLPKLSMATLSPTKEESMGDDESSDSSNKRESAIERLQKTEGSDTRKKEVIGHVDCKSRPESRKLSNEQSARGKVINTSGHSHAPESLKSATSPPVYVENVPPRESSRCQTSQDETKKASLQNDNVEGNILPFASATTDLLNSCNQDRGQVESQNGSEGPQNSAFPQTPKQRWHPPSWSANGTSTNPGGIRVVQKSPTVTSAACATQDQAVQCNLSPKKARSRSIDTTPERFYAMKREPSRILDSSADDVFSGQQKHGCRQKKPFLLHGPRLSKSYENFSSQTRITLESPTNSTKSKDLGKNGSVRAMAAMFDVQPSGLGSSAMTGDEQATMANSVRDGDRNSKSDSALTRRTAFLLDTTQRPVSTTGTTRNGNDRFDEVMGDVMEKQSVADSINHSASLDSETDGICQPSTPGDKATAKADLDEADSRRIRMMPSLGRMGPYPEQPPIAHHLSLTRPPSSPSPMMESEADSILDAIPLPQVARSGSATVLYSQIRKLQRQLNSKTEEAAQLRRQLAAQQDSDVGTVSEQLRQAKRDAAMWKERAEAAERRVKVFEKFTEKLKKIRDELADAKKYEKGDGDGKDGDGRARVADATIKAVDRLRLLQGQSAKKEPGNPDDCSDGTAQTRKRPHDVVKSQDGAVDRSRPASDSPAGEEGGKLGSRGGMEVRMRRRSDQIWAAAEELLQMEEDGVE